MWTHGLQWVVYVLQEFKENGSTDNTVRGEVVVPRGLSFTENWGDSGILNSFLQLMAMNVVPRLVLDDA